MNRKQRKRRMRLLRNWLRLRRISSARQDVINSFGDCHISQERFSRSNALPGQWRNFFGLRKSQPEKVVARTAKIAPIRFGLSYGLRADRMIIDDPLNPAHQATSESSAEVGQSQQTMEALLELIELPTAELASRIARYISESDRQS